MSVTDKNHFLFPPVVELQGVCVCGGGGGGGGGGRGRGTEQEEEQNNAACQMIACIADLFYLFYF